MGSVVTQQTVKISNGDTQRSLWIRFEDELGEPIDVNGDTITFTLTHSDETTVKVNAQSANEKQSGAGITLITAATAANPVVVTSASHGLSNGDQCFIRKVVGMTELNGTDSRGKQYQAANVTANTFELNTPGGAPVNGSQFTPYESGGEVNTVGMASYDWASGDVDTSGVYYGQFESTSASKTLNAPVDSKGLRIEVVD